MMHFVLFDIDGTLIDSGGAGGAAFLRALTEEFNIDLLVDGVPMSGRTDRSIARDLFQKNNLEFSPENWSRFQKAYLDRLPETLVSRAGHVLPGVSDLLIELAGSKRIELGLLTGNMAAGAKLKLTHFGIYKFFQFGAYGDHPFDRDGIARLALDDLRERFGTEFSAEQIWIVGDTPLDIQCARAIGAKAVAVATGTHNSAQLSEAQPDHLLDDLTDAKSLLPLWS